MKRVILASASPRRRELLAELISDFEVIPSNVDETLLAGMHPAHFARGLAEVKVRTVYELNPGALVIGADTIVAFSNFDGEWTILGKPSNPVEAEGMLASLSGREHSVITGICLVWGPVSDHAAFISASDTTQVRFRSLSQEEIAAYVATGEPMDKAGAYAIQGGAKDFVERIDGSWSNVVGLPLETLAPMLKRALADL